MPHNSNHAVRVWWLTLIVFSLLALVTSCSQTRVFEGDRAYEHVLTQMELGPRTPGTKAHTAVIAYITRELEKENWSVDLQQSELNGLPIQNVIARRGSGSEWVIFGAHYDSRLYSDQDDDLYLQTQPVPGANDGASGVAVLLELARTIPTDLTKEVWLVFFDAEDQGRIDGWEWIMGSQVFVQSLTRSPEAVIIIDMVGDTDLNIYREISSDAYLTEEIWETAATLNYSEFFYDTEKYNILDDHVPFLEAGIPAIDIIDFNYPYWHTSQDTIDKISAKSLEIVGKTLLEWLEN